jgi:uncharacterized protein YqjF (DUF2071 family)
LIPSVIELDIFDGWCWIGIVPFQMTDVRPRYFPMSFAFPELNVRTYVSGPAGPGVWFFSLDATNWLAVRAARWLGMPYFDARMSVAEEGEYMRARSKRVHRDASPAEFDALYKPTGPIYYATPGTLDHWLTERYCLYAALSPNKIVYGEIHHAQWRLQPAEVELKLNTMTKQLGLTLPAMPPLCHFSRLQEVVAWPVVPLEENSEHHP